MRNLSRHTDALSPREAVTALEALCLMLAGSDLREADPLVRAVAGASVHEQICAFIDRHLDDPALNPARIAAGCRVSRATLYRLFGFDGGVMAYVAGRRLDRAFASLSQHDGDRSGIAQPAYRSGFTSETHFSRSFRNRFAMTQREARSLGEMGMRPVAASGLGPRDWVSRIRLLRETF